MALVPNGSVGGTPTNQIVDAVVYTARLQQIKASDLTTFSEEDWDGLFASAFGSSFGSVRLAIIQSLAEVSP